MKVVILAGGTGSRISEESMVRPKPMIEIGGMPILWHIMKIYSHCGYNDFIICLGYKGYMIKEFFSNYYMHMSDMTVDLGANTTEIHRSTSEPWRVTMIDTGESTMTGGRIKRVERYLEGQPFMLTYGDGVADIDVAKLQAYHENHGKKLTLTAVKPPGRFGLLNMEEGGRVLSFQEKPDGDGGYINGGFFVCQPEVLDRIDGDQTVWERGPMEALAREGEMKAYRHPSFWYAMDTLRDKNHLESLWASGKAPWKTWR